MKEQIYKLVHRKDFAPFALHLSDGRAIPVPTRDHILVTLNPRAYIIVENDRGISELITTLHITSVESEQQQNA